MIVPRLSNTKSLSKWFGFEAKDLMVLYDRGMTLVDPAKDKWVYR